MWKRAAIDCPGICVMGSRKIAGNLEQDLKLELLPQLCYAVRVGERCCLLLEL
jgi:hypothetical protein